MESKPKRYPDYTNYIKCGEILKPPVPSYQDSIILKCLECNKVHFLFEAFVKHIDHHFNDLLSPDEQISKTIYENVHVDEWDSEGIDNVSIKQEDLEDPLITVKCEVNEEKSTEKEANTTEEIRTSVHYFDAEQCNEFEEDSNESETDVDNEIIKESSPKRKTKVLKRLQKIDSNMPDITSDQIVEILQIYQRFPHLWNTYLIENICLNKRRDAHIAMLKVLETEMNLNISLNGLEEYIRTIHNYFSKEKRQRLDCSKQNTIDNKMNKTNEDTKYFSHMSFLENHEGPFDCSECGGIYMKPLCYRVHKSQHDGTIPLSCSQCNQDFKGVASYTSHAKRHLGNLQFICKECNTKFRRHSDLKIHMLTHTGARLFCCEICGALYRQNNSFKKHQRRHENRFSHTCHICSKGYYSKYRYIDHMNSHTFSCLQSL